MKCRDVRLKKYASAPPRAASSVVPGLGTVGSPMVPDLVYMAGNYNKFKAAVVSCCHGDS